MVIKIKSFITGNTKELDCEDLCKDLILHCNDVICMIIYEIISYEVLYYRKLINGEPHDFT